MKEDVLKKLKMYFKQHFYTYRMSKITNNNKNNLWSALTFMVDIWAQTHTTEKEFYSFYGPTIEEEKNTW